MIIIIITLIIKSRRHDAYNDYLFLLGVCVCMSLCECMSLGVCVCVCNSAPVLNWCHSASPCLASGISSNGADVCV